MSKSLYQRLVEAEIQTDNYCSDLYFPVTEQSTEIVREFNLSAMTITKFPNEIDGKEWYEAAFLYDPYWENEAKFKPHYD